MKPSITFTVTMVALMGIMMVPSAVEAQYLSELFSVSGPGSGESFGYSAAGLGDINGDLRDDYIVGTNDQGVAYVFLGAPEPSGTPDLTLTNAEASFGRVVSAAGDVNGDGYNDFLVGAPLYNGNRGRAFLYLGGPVPDGTADVIFTGDTAGGFLGSAIAALGDVNNDGKDDIVIGEQGYNDWRGRASVYLGASPMNNSADKTWQGSASYQSFGGSVAGPGDVNNDGYHDILIGASGQERAYLYLGGTSLPTSASLTFSGSAARIVPGAERTAQFGGFVSGVGDINNDGFRDVIIAGSGSANIYFGGNPMNTTRDGNISSSPSEMIPSGCSAGDINGDEYGDFVIGEGYYNGGVGRVRVFLGGTTIDTTPDQTLSGSANSYFGGNVIFGDNIITSNQGDEIIITESGANSNDGGSRIYGSEEDCECGASFNATPNGLVCTDAGSAVVQFLGVPQGPVTSWLWSFGDGGTSSEQNPQHTYTTLDSFDVSLTVGCEPDCGSFSVTAIDYIILNRMPTASWITGSQVKECNGTRISFTDQSTPSKKIDSWLWSFGDGQTSTEKSPDHIYLDSDTLTVSLTVTNACGQDVLSKDQFEVLVKKKPEAKIGVVLDGQHVTPGASITIEECNFLCFEDLSDPNNTPITEWFWDFYGDGSKTLTLTGQGNPPERYYYPPKGVMITKDTTFTATLRATNECGTDQVPLSILVTLQPGDEKPDLIVDDLSVAKCGKTVTVTIKNLENCAHDIDVVVNEEDKSGGSGGVRRVGTYRIDRLGEDQRDTKMLAYDPMSRETRLFAEVDSIDAIDETNENNNTRATPFTNSPPIITQVSAQWDGLSSNDQIGTFIATIPAQNTITASVTDPNGSDEIEKVEFTLGGQTIVDSNPAGGWTATFDMGSLSPGNNLLVITAYDCWDKTDTKTVTVKVFPFPDWVPIQHQAWFDANEGVYHMEIPMPPQLAWEYGNALPGDILAFGGKDNSQETDFTLEMEGSVAGVYGIGASGEMETELLGIDFSGDYSFMGRIQVGDAIAFKGANGALTLRFSKDFPSVPIARYPIVPLVITAKLDFFFSIFGSGALRITLDEDLDFVSPTSFTPTLSPSINIIGEVEILFGLCGAQLIASPTLTFVMPIQYTTAEGVTVNFNLTFSIPWRAVAYFLFWDKEVASGELGPWTFIDTETLQDTHEIEGMIASMPDLDVMPPYPSIDTSPLGMAVAVWVAPSPSANAIYYSFWDGSQWSAEMALSADDVGVNNPQVKFLSNGSNAVAVWTQAKAGVQLGPATPINDVLDVFELYYSFYQAGGGWSTPEPLTNNTRGDGYVSIDIHTASDIMAVWTYTSDSNWHTRSDWEIHYSRWNGTNWSSPAAIPGTDDGDADCAVDIAYTSSGKAVAVWLHNEDTDNDTADFNTPEDLFLEYAIWNGSSWGPVMAYDPSNDLVADPDVEFSDSGIGILAWQQIESIGDTLYHYTISAAYYNSGTESWGTPEVAAQSLQLSEKPLLATFTGGGYDLAVIAYRGYKDGDEEIFAVVKDLTNLQSPWTDPVALTADSLTDWMAAMDIDAAMNILLLNGKLNMWPGSVQKSDGNFAEGLQFTAKGIASDLAITDDLNFASASLLQDLSMQGEGITFRTSGGEPLAFPAIGDSVMIRVEVENIGRTVSGATLVDCYDGDPEANGALIDQYSLASIAPDSSCVHEVLWIALPGKHDIYVEVDPLNVLVEASEDNNKAFRSHYVASDLVITMLRFEQDNPLAGEIVTVEATVSNIGDDVALSNVVRFFDGHPDSLGTAQIGDDAPYPDLAAGSDAKVSVNFPAPSGVLSVYAVVDPDSSVVETDEENNQAFATLMVLPDLVPSPDSPAIVDLGGNQFSISVTVANTGGVDAADVRTVFYDGDPLLDGISVGGNPPFEVNPIDSVLVPVIAARQSSPVTITWTAPFGLSEVYIVIDPHQSIVERDENNNKIQGELLSVAPADLYLESGDISFSDNNPKQGDDITIYAVIRNNGIRPVHYVSVRAYDGYPSAEDIPVGEAVATFIAPNGSTTLEIEWSDIALAGNREVCIWIDPYADVTETDENNNMVFTTLSVEAGLIGDVDNNGTINVLDVLRVVNFILEVGNPPSEFELLMSDCNQDGNINVLDVLGIVNIILGLGTCPPTGRIVLTRETMEFIASLAFYLFPEDFNRLMALVKEVQVPEEFALFQNYPNPFNPATAVNYQIPMTKSQVQTTLKVYNILGQEVATLVDERKGPGYYTVTWDGRDKLGNESPSGVYFYQLKSGEFIDTKRMVLMK